MPRIRLLNVGALLAAISLVAACAAETSQPPRTDGSTQATIGPAGGSIEAEGVSLVIPKGAVETDQTITVTPTDEAPPNGVTPYSRVVRFEPSGLVFAAPV